MEDAARPLRALVALDGSACAEAALMPAARLITALAAPAQGVLHLAQIVKLPPEGSKKDDEADADAEEQALRVAANYLEVTKKCKGEKKLFLPLFDFSNQLSCCLNGIRRD